MSFFYQFLGYRWGSWSCRFPFPSSTNEEGKREICNGMLSTASDPTQKLNFCLKTVAQWTHDEMTHYCLQITSCITIFKPCIRDKFSLENVPKLIIDGLTRRDKFFVNNALGIGLFSALGLCYTLILKTLRFVISNDRFMEVWILMSGFKEILPVFNSLQFLRKPYFGPGWFWNPQFNLQLISRTISDFIRQDSPSFLAYSASNEIVFHHCIGEINRKNGTDCTIFLRHPSGLNGH